MSTAATGPLAGRRAIVTGSTGGIGLATACTLARAGAAILLNGFGDVEAARRTVAAFGSPVVHHAADMRRPGEIAAMIACANDAFGGIDILVNNAGIQHIDLIPDFPVEQWDAILAVNLSAAFHTMRAVLPAMTAQGWGRIVNIASVHGLVASAGKSAYVAAKHGLIGLTRAAALENAASGVTINALCPGWVATALAERQVAARAGHDGVGREDAERRLLAEKQPSMRFTQPDELGEIVLFLCSPAAHNVQGAAWSVDGGWTAQ